MMRSYAVAVLAVVSAVFGARAETEIERGKYLAEVLVCGECHTPGALLGKPDKVNLLGGSEVGYEIPGLGVFYGANLTPDVETGLGNWSNEEIVTALRTGVRPDGRILSAAMPWRSFAALTDGDARAVAVYLKSLKPFSRKVPGPFGPTETPTSFYYKFTVPPKPAAAAPPAPTP
ncbi:MAG: cytochrome c [Rhodospirillaceae bacterium]|nr:cytochrome c [Rhodospirillaceae bacterium]